MVLNRGWADSPGSSIELLGGWEDAGIGDGEGEVGVEGVGEDGDGDRVREEERKRRLGLGNTELYGWPGLLFEVLKNDVVECVTVF